MTWMPDTIYTSTFLSFAGIGPIAIPAIPIAQHLAEKVHAYTRSYGDQNGPSTRPKDLVDILIIAAVEEIGAASLRDALAQTFTTRGRQPLPQSLPAAPTSWEAPFGRLATGVGVESDLTSAVDQARLLLDPLLDETATGNWDPRQQRWVS